MKSLIVAFIICFGFMFLFVKLIQCTDRDKDINAIKPDSGGIYIDDRHLLNCYTFIISDNRSNDSILYYYRISGNDTIWSKTIIMK